MILTHVWGTKLCLIKMMTGRAASLNVFYFTPNARQHYNVAYELDCQLYASI